MIDAYSILVDYGEETGTEDWGYPSDKLCCLCQGKDRNQSEPRFGYTVCIKHQHIPPTVISRMEEA